MSTQTRRPLAGSPFAVPTEVVPEVYRPDDRVSHDRYGLGRVVDVEGDLALTIECGTTRVRVTSPFRSIERL